MTQVFVFGSNEAGNHGAGAALTAKQQHGARQGQGYGPMVSRDGSAGCFAVPTKDWQIQTLPIASIEHYVQRFIVFARIHKNVDFKITALGCGLAGLRHDVIAPMFKYAPANCSFDEVWAPYLPKDKKFWGTYP